MKRFLVLTLLLTVVQLEGIQLNEEEPATVRRRAVTRVSPSAVPSVVVRDDFRNGDEGWDAGFSDYSPANDANGSMELDSGIRQLPPGIMKHGSAFYVTGHNRSDDLFMFLKKKLTIEDGIQPNQTYHVSYRVTVASNAGGEQCGGIGGHPGFSVYLKVGGAGVEPQVLLIDEGTGPFYYLNLDKGNQSASGCAATVAGDISTGSDHCYSDAPFHSLVREQRHLHVVTADSVGTVWLLVGTDSGFEGKTELYYQSVEATLTPVP
ncbi:MAG: hypothetical protein KY432_07325 [Acidobacteria bacterium]|nr:hypothetical protein [Acidobacteriota bacterium]